MQATLFYLSVPVRYGIVRAAMKKRHPIDTEWFLNRMEDLSLTMYAPKGEAARLRRTTIELQGQEGQLDYSSFYRMIHGQRAMSLSEAVQLSEILKTPLDTIAKKALGKKR